MIENRFLHFLTLSAFDAKRDQISNSAIVFIDSDDNSKPTIWTHGKYYSVGGSISSLPIASATVLGGIKVGSGLTITADGVLSASGSGGPGTIGGVQYTSNSQIVPTDEESFSEHITLHKISKTGNYDNLINKPSFSTVAISGSYNDLTNKPTIPTVSDARITIMQGGSEKGSFTLNQNGSSTIQLSSGGPEDTSELEARIDGIDDMLDILSDALSLKQGLLTAGTGINIDENNVISATGTNTLGSLVTDVEESLLPRSGERFNTTIQLNRIAKTGSYKHLVDLPTGVFTNFLAFDDDGGFMDSGYNASSFCTQAQLQALQEQITRLLQQIDETSEKIPNGLSWEINNVVVSAITMIQHQATPTLPSLVNTTEKTPTYSSSNTSVATINSNTGVVTVTGTPGTTTISASYSGDENYSPGYASYTITVNADSIESVTWQGGSVGDNSLNVNETTTFTKGNVYVTYASHALGYTNVDVTALAQFNCRGIISSNTYQAPSTVGTGTDTITCSYQNVSANNTITITLSAVVRKTLSTGSGGTNSTYNDVTFINSNRTFTAGMQVPIIIQNDADYIYIKTDSLDSLTSINVANSPIPQEFSLSLVGTADGYKYYKTTQRFGTEGGAETEQFIIN